MKLFELLETAPDTLVLDSFATTNTMLEKYEPKLYKAVNNIFRDSYEYTRGYNEFKKRKSNEESKK